MSYITNKDFLVEVSKGKVAGHSIVHKFGQNDAVGTSFVPIARGGIYRTVQLSGATELRIKAGNSNDTAGGSGAQEITLTGIIPDGSEVTEVLATAGTSPSATTVAKFIRLYRAYISGSGTYATSSAGSHLADIVIENGAGGTDWGTIALNGFPRSQTEIGCYTIPVGFTGFLLSASGFSDSSKTSDILFFKREGIIETVAPYQAMRSVFEVRVEGSDFTVDVKAPINLGTGCDCGFMGKIDAGNSDIEVDFEILLIDNDYL